MAEEIAVGLARYVMHFGARYATDMEAFYAKRWTPAQLRAGLAFAMLVGWLYPHPHGEYGIGVGWLARFSEKGDQNAILSVADQSKVIERAKADAARAFPKYRVTWPRPRRSREE